MSSMARNRQPDDVRAKKRDDILEAAMAVFEKHGGLEALSFRRLATEMELSYSAPYRYFASKDELVNALRARAFRWIEQAMLTAIAGLDDPEAQLEALAAAYIRSGIERPDRYALMFFKLDDTDVARRSIELKAARRDALDVCRRVIAAGQASGHLPDRVDPLTAAHLFWIGAHGLVSLQVAGQFVMGRDLPALVPTLIRCLRAGLEHFDETPASRRTTASEEIRHVATHVAAGDDPDSPAHPVRVPR